MIRIALDMNDVGPGVLGAVAEAVDDDAASDRSVSAGVTRLGRGRELERSDGSRQRFTGQTKSKRAKRRPRQAGAGELDKAATLQFHRYALPSRLAPKPHGSAARADSVAPLTYDDQVTNPH